MNLRRLWELPAWMLHEQIALFPLSREFADFRALNPTRLIGPHVGIRSLLGLSWAIVMIKTGALVHCGCFEWSRGQEFITIGDRAYIEIYSVVFGVGGITFGCDALI